MKIRILITVLSLAVWGFLNRGIFQPVDILTKNTLAVATVNGGDGAFVAQNAYNAFSPLFSGISTVALIVLIVAIWAKTISKNF